MKVAFQGELGAYSEEAIIQHFGEEAQPVPRPYLKDVFDTVENGEADLGLIPAENSLEGSIVRTFDLLLERGLKIQGETILRVIHCLIANKGVALGDVKSVYSHPQALDQCRFFLDKFLPAASRINMASTAEAATLVAQNEGIAAIASRRVW